MLTWIELGPVWLSLRLAAVTTVILLIIGLPLAWWLVKGRSALCAPMNAVVTLPLVLPPSVLGFYILIALGPNGPIGQVTDALGLGTLNFTFTGLVIGSVVYSLPFMIQPVVTAFEAIGPRPMEVAATLGCRPFEAFFRVILLQVVKRIVPPMSNEIITLVKDTSLSRVIACYEIIWNAQVYIKSNGLIWPLFYTGVFYLLFNGILTVFFGWLERKMSYFRV